MINIFNNHLKFKVKYLSLHKGGAPSNLNTNNLNSGYAHLLKKRIKFLYNLSHNLNKFSKKNPALFLKSLPYLTSGHNSAETESMLKLSHLSRKGLNILKATPKASKSLLYPNGNVSTSLVGKIGTGSIRKYSNIGRKFEISHIVPFYFKYACAPFTPTVSVAEGYARSSTFYSNNILKSPQDWNHSYSSKPSLIQTAEQTKDSVKEEWNQISRVARGTNSRQFTFSENLSGGAVSLNKERMAKLRSDSQINNKLVSGRMTNLEHKLKYKKNKNIKKDNLLVNWIKEWEKKKTEYSKLSSYNVDDSDKRWFSAIAKVRQIISSKYVFDPLLARSQSINYFFNTNQSLSNGYVRLNLIQKILKSFFSSFSILISKPIFILSPNKVNIRLFYYNLPSKTQLIKNTKEKILVRKRGKLYEEKKNRREFRKIMKNFKMKVFIAKWKESNNLIQFPYLSDTIFKLWQGAKPCPSSKDTGTNNKTIKVDIPSHFTVQSNISTRLKEHANFSEVTVKEDNGIKFNQFSEGWQRPLSSLVKDKSLQFLKKRYTVPSAIVSLNKNKFKYLIFILEKAFNKTVILDLIRLKYPYHDSNILVQILGLSSKNKNFRIMMRKLLYTANIKNPTKMIRKQNFSIIPSYLSGIKVKLAGRLITQRVVPRFTVQSFQIGSLARGKVNYVDTSRFTHKNKRGAFSFTVTTSHIFDANK